MKASRIALVYLSLLAGGVLFAWPFIWMAATSAKLERELFSHPSQTMPEAPRPQSHSPYVDKRLFADVTGPRLDETIATIKAQLNSASFPLPRDVGSDASFRTELARGVYQRLLAILPAEIWNGTAEALAKAVSENLTSSLVADLSGQLRHSLCLGELRVRSDDLREDQLVAADKVAASWDISGNATLEQVTAESESYAELHYNFDQSDVIRLTRTFHTTFPVAQLHRVQLSIRHDDTWHALALEVEKNGQLWRAERAIDDADINWAVDAWQEPRADDRPEKIRTWTALRKAASGPRFMNRPNELRITLQLRRRTAVAAWWAKLAHNYRLTLDYIPFWRYAATSLFLIALNLVGTLSSCSLVAYAFARLNWPGRSIAFALLLATMMVPPQVTMIPQFLIFQKLGWYNTLKPLWVTSFFATAFNVFLLRQFMKGIPGELEDAARLDGCGFLRIYWHVVLPLVKPALAAVAIFTVLATWNDFLLPLIYVSDQRLYPLSFGLYAFQIQALMPGTSAGVGMLMAGALLMMLPVIVMFFFAQRFFLQGVTWSGIKL